MIRMSTTIWQCSRSRRTSPTRPSHSSKKLQFSQAHARIDRVLSTYPNVASLHFLKAQIYGFEHNGQGAEAELNKTLELDANYVQAYYALAALFINSKQEDRAIAEYRKL